MQNIPRMIKASRWARYRLRRSIKALLALGGKCVRCGCRDFRVLEIDHIKPERAGRHEIGAVRRRRAIAQALMQDRRQPIVQCLCANCHRIKTWEEDHPGVG